MTQDESHNRTPLAAWVALRVEMDAHPDARIATMYSPSDSRQDGELMELRTVVYYPHSNTIELEFD